MDYRPWYNEHVDYQTNAKSYMEYLGRVNKFMKVLMEDYEVFQELVIEELERIKFDSDMAVDDILNKWLEDGTLARIINDGVLGNKADKKDVEEVIQQLLTKADKTYVDQEFNLLNQLKTDKTYVDQEFNRLNQLVDIELDQLNERKVSEKETKIHYFDFSLKYSSKCILVEAGGKTILIDTGDRNHSQEAISKIKNKGIQSIDYLIITHYHSDHSGGVPNFVDSGLINSNTISYLPPTPNWERMKVIGSAGGSNASDWEANERTTFNVLNGSNTDYVFPSEKQWIELGEDVSMRFHNTLPTYFEAYYNDLTNDNVFRNGVDYNNFSLVTEIKNGNKHFIFTGDLGIQAQKQLRNTFDHPIYFYDIEHHGLNYSYDKQFFKQINPKYVGIQNADMDYNYFSRGSYGYLKSLGSQLFITGINGDIDFFDSVEGMNIKTSRTKGTAESGQLHSYHLTGGYTVLEKDTHLDHVTEAGIYITRTIEDVSGVSGLPSHNGETVTSSFKLIVETYHDSSRIRQTLMENSGRGYIWYRTFSTNNQWNPWFRVAQTRDLFYSRIGTPLEEGTDLNLITESGKYSAPTNDIAQTIINKPDEVDENFTIEIYPLHDPDRFYQTLKVINARNDEYTRVYSLTGYHPWNKVNKTYLGSGG